MYVTQMMTVVIKQMGNILHLYVYVCMYIVLISWPQKCTNTTMYSVILQVQYICMHVCVVGYLARKHVGQVKQGTISKANCNCQAYLTCNSYRTLFQK